EMAAALPYMIHQRLLDSKALPPEVADRVHQRLKRIEDVRPLFASFRWAYYAVERIAAEIAEHPRSTLRDALDDSVRSLARSFRDLDFYQEWYERKHSFCSLDAPLVLRAILTAFSSRLFPARQAAEIVERALLRWAPADRARLGAQREDLA